MCPLPMFMLRLRGLFFLTLILPATVRRSIRTDDYMLTKNRTTSAEALKPLIPGGFGKALSLPRGLQAGASLGARRPFGSRRATVAMQSKELERAFELEDGASSAHHLPAMRTAMPSSMRNAMPFAMRDVGSRRTAGIMMAEGPPKFSLPATLLRFAVPAIITAESLRFLVELDVPSLSSAKPEYLRTAVDLFILAFGINSLAGLAGVRVNVPPQPSLAGLDCSVKMNVGREPGTAMPKEWAASGARLPLPLTVRFSDEPLDLGFPGEQLLGGRKARRLECKGGSFVGFEGKVVVAAEGGAWSVLPSPQPGKSILRFFIDFPQGAARNDVSIPAGRVFFSCSVWDSEKRRAAAGAEDEVVEAPSGVLLSATGRVIVKRNDPSNLGGAFGDVNLLLGRFTVQRNTPTDTAEHSVPQPAAPL